LGPWLREKINSLPLTKIYIKLWNVKRVGNLGAPQIEKGQLNMNDPLKLAGIGITLGNTDKYYCIFRDVPNVRLLQFHSLE
jgi:hypothetical protein